MYSDYVPCRLEGPAPLAASASAAAARGCRRQLPSEEMILASEAAADAVGKLLLLRDGGNAPADCKETTYTYVAVVAFML